ncbi:hypothetical protein [Methanogenium cariaci]|uniref:hypothetical protein n=1 Tax=Methanogenium cariaci TaxID=2197 RepID=UPI000B0CEB6F|nr:hypothetical protein [Methanogenium cariaci]
MSIFLDLIPVSEAEEVLRKIAPLMGEETVALSEAYNRVLFRPATAGEDIPGFTRSVVDGYAVRATDTVGAGEALPAMLTITGRVGMGDGGDAGEVAPNECRYVPTGAVIPECRCRCHDRVCRGIRGRCARLPGGRTGGKPHPPGDDFQKGDRVFPAGRCLSPPRDLGVMGALGITTVPVCRQPVLGIISTGNELISPEQTPGPGRYGTSTPISATDMHRHGGTIPPASMASSLTNAAPP